MGWVIFGWLLILGGDAALLWSVMSVADTTDDEVESEA
jgi:hypothetical protein